MMIDAIQVFIISIIFLGLAYFFRKEYKKDLIKRETYERTYAVIDRAIFSDGGNVMYYVIFEENGKKHLAQTDHYTSETKSLNPGDIVEIGYYLVKGNKFIKGDRFRAVIFDDRVISCGVSFPTFYRVVAVIGVLLLMLAIGIFIHAKMM